LTISEQPYFVMDNASQNTKRQEMLEMGEAMAPLATPKPAGDLLGPCGRPGALGHHVVTNDLDNLEQNASHSKTINNKNK